MKCSICDLRKARRHCPGLNQEICPVCCGNEREESIRCPHDCEYLRESRLHERAPEIPADQVPNRDVPVTEEFIESHEALVSFASGALLQSALDAPDAVDNDLREAIESLIRTYRTLQTGLYFESRPDNPIAAAIQHGFQERLEDLRKRLAERASGSVRDAEVLGVLVFLQRVEMQHNNGRRMGRAFLDFLRSYFAPARQPDPAPSLILP